MQIFTFLCMIRFILLFGLALLSFQSVYSQSKREFRGVWIATVANIDWPGSKDQSSLIQQQEFRMILDEHQKSGINAIFVQVRPAADAFYAKSKEPWSFWLTGKQGQAPVPFYDPLQFMIDEAHKRGMEIHAWFNPYRASHKSNTTPLAPNHITRQKPEWFFTYDGMRLFNPGIPVVREYITSVIMDVVKNYDVDGIHLDDYFYPYPIARQVIPDDATFRQFPNGFTNKNDWRRNNVNLLIKMLNDSIKYAKPYVKFGVSPFGIWKNASSDPQGSPTSGGESFFTQFADSREWAKQGWVDYILPQLYWHSSHPRASYTKLVDWWSKNSFDSHLYLGMGAYRIGARDVTDWQNPNHMPNQIKYGRDNNKVSGFVYYSSKSLMANLLGFTDSLRSHLHANIAIPPTMPWKDNVPPLSPPELSSQIFAKQVVLNWKQSGSAIDGDSPRAYGVYRFDIGEDFDIDNPKKLLAVVWRNTSFTDQTIQANKKYVYIITAFDRLWNESAPDCKLIVSTLDLN